MSVRAISSLVIVLAAPSIARAESVRPWVGPGIHGSPTTVGAGNEDGHYRPLDGLVLFGGSVEGGLAVFPTLLFSLGLEYNVVVDTSPEPKDESPAMTGLNVPFRARVWGIGSESGRFYVVLGIGYATVWDRTHQLGASTNDPASDEGSALRSSGALYELGFCYRQRLSDWLALEIGLVPRLQLMGASNGRGYYSNAWFSQTSIPLRVSLPFTF